MSLTVTGFADIAASVINISMNSLIAALRDASINA